MSGSPTRILLVDDDEGIRGVIGPRLANAGYEVVEASDGEEALERLSEGGVSLALLDVMLPDMDGYEILAKIREGRIRPPVIFLSAAGEVEHRLRGFQGGAVDYVTKPFDPRELLARIESALHQRAKFERARAEARIDALTGLANRFSYERSLVAEAARAVRYGRILSLILIDADKLKQTNDRLGHPAGDELLRAIARAIRATCRETDRPARIGGDEFAILLPETARSDAEAFLDRLRRAVEAEVVGNGEASFRPEFSAGLAILPDDAKDKESLHRAADEALYRDKMGRTLDHLHYP